MGNPMARDAANRVTKQSIGNEGEQDRDDCCLRRKELAQEGELIDYIHDYAENKDPRRRHDAFPQAASASLCAEKDL